MKPTSPHDPLDDLIAAALHDAMTPEERRQFEFQLQNDPTARAAYQETQLMHDLLEKTQREDRPDPAFEQRMVSGVRRKIQNRQNRETSWESLLILLRAVKNFLTRRWIVGTGLAVFLVFGVLLFLPMTQSHLFSRYSTQPVEDYAKTHIPAAHPPAPAFAIDSVSAETRNGFRAAASKIVNASETPAPADSSAVVIADADSRIPVDKSVVATMGRNFPSAWSGFVPRGATTTTLLPTSSQHDIAMDQLSRPAAGTQGPASDGQSGHPASLPPTDSSPSRKLVRNADLDLEVQSFQTAMDQIAASTKVAGGYVGTSSSERGGNGKLQGTVVVKVLPENLDAFLLKLRDLGDLKNQSISTDDVTKAYYDINARLDNSRRMEAQLQQLLQHDNGKVSDLLQVERELGRVRGEIEQMQGELKVYDFQVAYATVTIQISEKDLHQAAAYLLKEQDNLTLFSGDVETSFQQARKISDDFKAQILSANLNHSSPSDISADLEVMVAPEQIEPFLAQIKALGRIGSFTKQNQRVAQDGGDSGQPADQTRTETDKVQVQIALRSDDESRKRVALTVVTRSVDEALDQAKTAALAQPGAEIISSSLNKAAEGQSTAALSVRVPGRSYQTILAVFRSLGRTSSFDLQRNDNAGPGSAGDDSPVLVSLSLTDNDVPVQHTAVSVLVNDVDQMAQQIKKQAVTDEIEIRASSFERHPNGVEVARMTFHLSMGKYPAFLENLRQLGKIGALSVTREDRPDQSNADETAPVAITLELHNRGDLVADDRSFWPTLRQTFGEGAEALFDSARIIGVGIAFIIPWILALLLVAWLGRRLYVWGRK